MDLHKTCTYLTMFFIDTLYLSSCSSVLRDSLKGENDRKLLNVPRKIKRKPKTIFKKISAASNPRHDARDTRRTKEPSIMKKKIYISNPAMLSLIFSVLILKPIKNTRKGLYLDNGESVTFDNFLG